MRIYGKTINGHTWKPLFLLQQLLGSRISLLTLPSSFSSPASQNTPKISVKQPWKTFFCCLLSQPTDFPSQSRLVSLFHPLFLTNSSPLPPFFFFLPFFPPVIPLWKISPLSAQTTLPATGLLLLNRNVPPL